MIEKAWAKTHGSYAQIEGGSSKYILRDLTGAPTYAYSTASDINVLFQMVCEAD